MIVPWTKPGQPACCCGPQCSILSPDPEGLLAISADDALALFNGGIWTVSAVCSGTETWGEEEAPQVTNYSYAGDFSTTVHKSGCGLYVGSHTVPVTRVGGVGESIDTSSISFALEWAVRIGLFEGSYYVYFFSVITASSFFSIHTVLGSGFYTPGSYPNPLTLTTPWGDLFPHAAVGANDGRFDFSSTVSLALSFSFAPDPP